MIVNQGKHLSAEDVFNEAKAKYPNIGIATVYRTLEKLAGLNILYKTVFEGGRYRYESGRH
jgi:Fur family ferric uptake transcriptional regulator